jgi:soluble lytic murein transglycosylase-like protein
MQFCLELILGTAVATLMAATLSAASPSPGGALQEAPPAIGNARAVWIVKVDTRTGKLVRSLVAAPRPAGSVSANTGSEIRGWIAEAAKSFDVSPLLVDSVVQVESNYNPFAVSPRGAQGLMQLMPGTAQRFGVTDVFDPKQNIEGGVRYLKLLQDTFQDDRLAIAAYNAGEKAVAKYKDVPPYPETVTYVAKVGKKYGQAKRAALNDNETKHEAKNGEEPKPTSTEEAPRHILAYVDPEGKLHIATR